MEMSRDYGDISVKIFSLNCFVFFGPRYTYGPIYVSAYFIFVTNPTNIFVEKKL